MAAENTQPTLWRVKESFAIPGGDSGMMRPYSVGAMLDGSDPLATTHRRFLEPAANAVEQATAAPGERRLVASLRLPSGVTQTEAVQHRTGHAHTLRTGATQMVHALPPEDINSPASTFAPSQPGLGVVADDVPDSQNLAGAPKAADVQAEQARSITEARQSGEASDANTEAIVGGGETASLQGDDAPTAKGSEETVDEADEAKDKTKAARGGRRRTQADQEGDGQAKDA